MDSQNRQLTLRIEGELAREGKIPITILAEKLSAAQRLFFNIGSALLGGGRRGTWKTEILEACNLQFVEARIKCLEIVTEVPLVQLATHPERDLGQQSLNRLCATLEALSEHNRTSLENLWPDYGQRSRILKSALFLLPGEESGYQISVATPAGSVSLTPELRPYLRALTREETEEYPEQSVQTITGKLYRIEVATGERHLGVISSNRFITCYYSQEYEDVISDLIPGSLVEVEGLATLNDRGDVDRIEDIVDVRQVQLTPLYWSRVIYNSRSFILAKPIQLLINFHDGIWVHEHQQLGIIAYGKSRSESLNAFRMEFAALWDDYALEEDDLLSDDAKALKKTMLNLVRVIEEI